jgi:ribosomal protein S18 acetylase RimI-like enzyme
MPMLLRADIADLPAVAALVNAAYRGESAKRGWTYESDYMGGQRTDVATLQRDLAAQPQALLLLLRDAPGGELLGCVWLEPAGAAVWYLGMLTIRPDLQARGTGRMLLAAAERAAADHGAARMRMTVINIRDTLIAWYERRGYARTGEVLPFPYEDDRFGVPARADLSFVVLEKALGATDVS